jgi:hypothetical protein
MRLYQTVLSFIATASAKLNFKMIAKDDCSQARCAIALADGKKAKPKLLLMCALERHNTRLYAREEE